MKVVDVEAEHIRDLALSAKNKSRSTVHAIVSVTSGFFRYCVKERIANTNPAARAGELYGTEMLPKASGKTQRALTDDEIGRAMEHVSEAFSALLALLAESGIRVGEALGRTWPSVDLQRETIAIVGQLGPDGDVLETKTKRKRVIPISARAASALREHRLSMLEQGQNVDTGVVFVTRNGKPQSKRNALRTWTTALDKIGVDAQPAQPPAQLHLGPRRAGHAGRARVRPRRPFACHHDPDALHPGTRRRTAAARITRKVLDDGRP